MIIAHTSELLSADEPGFVHALGLAVHRSAAVRGIHVVRGPGTPPPPAAEALLHRWRKPTSAVQHEWIFAPCQDDTADALLDVVTRVEPALLIAYTHARTGLLRLLFGSVAEGVARNSAVPVLLLPSGAPALVSAESGAVTLARALLLAGSREDTERAAAALDLLRTLAGTGPCQVELLHVEDGTPTPHVALPDGFLATQRREPGPLERAVAERVRIAPPNLVVMTSHGHDQLSDVVLSSHTERVLHTCRLPLLWVPAARAA